MERSLHRPQRACKACSSRKVSCDKQRPSCSRCSSRFIPCFYPKNPPLDGKSPPVPSTAKLVVVESLVVLRDSCTFDLSVQGERSLLLAAQCSADEDSASEPSLQALVKGVFEATGMDLSLVAHNYFEHGHTLLPILVEQDAVLAITRMRSCPKDDALALLVLSMHLFSQSPCIHPNHSVWSILYRTTKRLFLILHTSQQCSSIHLIQSGLLISAYECGHGRAETAHTTLSLTLSLFREHATFNASAIIPNSMEKERTTRELRCCWSGIVLIDRTITLSHTEYYIPLLMTIDTSFAVDENDQGKIDESDPCSILWNRARSALVVGEALTASRTADDNSLVEIEGALLDIAGKDISVSQDDSYPYCEAVAMSLSALVCIYSARERTENTCSKYESGIAKKFVIDVIFHMCQLAMETSPSGRWDPRRTCFLGLCCLYTAASSLTESQSERVSEQDFTNLKKGLAFYSSRWHIGGMVAALHNIILTGRSNILRRRSSATAAEEAE